MKRARTPCNAAPPTRPDTRSRGSRSARPPSSRWICSGWAGRSSGRCFARRSGETVRLSRSPLRTLPGIESEFAVGLAADLPCRAEAWTKEEVEAAVAWVGPAFEIVGTRLESGLAGAGMLAIADGGANIDFVCGPTDADWRSADLTAHPVTLRINGVEVASGHSAMLVFGDPISGVAWLANHPELGARGLKAGDVVTTGTCTGITPLSPGDEAEADYGALGKVRARFSG